MRRFSQRNSLVTLSDINITPLLDLAFVLLIIFIITTPLLEKGLALNLPSLSAQTSRTLTKNDIRIVEVNAQGQYALAGHLMPLDRIMNELNTAHRTNPNLVVDIRADKKAPFELVMAIFDGCQQRGITQMSVRGNPRPITP
jgi:biopolymer transport protein ExbD